MAERPFYWLRGVLADNQVGPAYGVSLLWARAGQLYITLAKGCLN